MCGIVGTFRPGRETCDEATLARMRDRMSHRGPDGVGYWQSGRRDCSFGHRRLSIIDLSTTANQPMVNASGDVALIFNGEIYNHADVRRELEALGKYRWVTDHSDTEVVLHAYEEWGLDCVKRFYGMFAIAFYDARPAAEHELAACREHLGKVRGAPPSDNQAEAESHAWESLVRVLLRTNEFVYID